MKTCIVNKTLEEECVAHARMWLIDIQSLDLFRLFPSSAPIASDYISMAYLHLNMYCRLSQSNYH